MVNEYTTAKYGKLTVINKVKEDEYGRPIVLCICDCGNKKEILYNSLRINHTKSCGCLKKEVNKKEEFESSFNRIFSRIKRDAKNRNYSFNITKEEFKELSKLNCFYCGCEPYQKTNNMPNGNYIYNGLDRLNNEIGYEIENVVPCCGRCNRAKDTMSVKEFYELITNIYKRMN